LNLAVGALDSVTSTRGLGNNTSTLSTLTIGKSSGSNTFGAVIGTVTNTNLTTQSNNIAVVKTGGSTQILSGVNTYTGSTTVSAGTLALSGSGAISGSSGLSIGNTAGTKLDVTAITPASFSLLSATAFDIGNTTGSNGLIDATGKTLNYNTTTLTLNILSTFGAGSYSYNLFDGTTSGSIGSFVMAGAYTGTFGSLANTVVSNATFSFDATSGTLSITAVPEPAAYGFALGGLLVGLVLMRRRTAARMA